MTLFELCYRLEKHIERARELHNAEEWQKLGEECAYNALKEEVEELRQAVFNHEGKERIISELLDVIVVAVRYAHKEWEK